MQGGGERWGCARCHDPDPEQAWRWLSARTQPRQPLIQESHFMVSVTICIDCGQRFVRVFSEQIDWHGGDDPQHTEIVPARPDELTALTPGASERTVVELLQRLCADGRPRLVRDWPSSGSIHTAWTTGHLWLPRHD